MLKKLRSVGILDNDGETRNILSVQESEEAKENAGVSAAC